MRRRAPVVDEMGRLERFLDTARRERELFGRIEAAGPLERERLWGEVFALRRANPMTVDDMIDAVEAEEAADPMPDPRVGP